MAPKDDGDRKDGGGEGFPVGATLVARWMGQTERTCVVVDRSACCCGSSYRSCRARTDSPTGLF